MRLQKKALNKETVEYDNSATKMYKKLRVKAIRPFELLLLWSRQIKKLKA